MDKIKRKFGAELKVRLPRVPYRETITRTTQSEYRHKKQSGGHGQFGHVLLRLEPMDRDQGFEFRQRSGGRKGAQGIHPIGGEGRGEGDGRGGAGRLSHR